MKGLHQNSKLTTEPPCQRNQAPVTLINSGRIKGGEGWGKRMIQRLNEENCRHKNTVLSTWRWCKQGWPRLSQTTDRWPCSHSLLLTLLNKYLFNLIIILNLQLELISNYLYFIIYTKCQILRETVSFVFPRVLGLKGKENKLVSWGI